MKGDYYLAIDIGASGGRHILGRVDGGKLRLTEAYRFANDFTRADGADVWDVRSLYANILAGMAKCREMGAVPRSAAIDTWAVDFVHLDAGGGMIGQAVAYRDARTDGMDAEVYAVVPEAELYARTGVQRQIFNTIFQLTAVRKKQPELLAATSAILMLPDYFNYLLTGVATSEYTNASSTGLLDARSGGWDYELIGRLGLPRGIFLPVEKPGRILGRLRPETARAVGYDCDVALPATHDTGSAVLAAARSDGGIYISSGTWSLMGVELPRPDTSEAARRLNFTNEGAFGGGIRFLKNIMGLWMIQRVRKELGGAPSFAELCAMAERETIPSLVDPDLPGFLAPESMIGEIRRACRETGQTEPETPGELAAVVYNSLAECYGRVAGQLESVTGRTYPVINVVGGGSNADYLNRLTAVKTGKAVIAGPSEATAVGNILAQMIASGDCADEGAARELARVSFDAKRYESGTGRDKI
ncbi:MAG: rhamnulokinase [Clostridiales bacterium]|jgi:rhamnulokinase|nr:rhamnulokinase [Clostridiales bacterium]